MMLKMTAKIFCLIFVLFNIKIMYEVCMTNYAESYALGQQLSLALAPRVHQGKVLT